MFGMILKITLIINTRVHAYTNILDLELEWFYEVCILFTKIFF